MRHRVEGLWRRFSSAWGAYHHLVGEQLVRWQYRVVNVGMFNAPERLTLVLGKLGDKVIHEASRKMAIEFISRGERADMNRSAD